MGGGRGRRGGRGRGRGRGETNDGGRGRGTGQAGRGAKYRRWTFTINNYKAVPTGLPNNVQTKYLCYGKEVGKQTETPHLQGFVEFKYQVYHPHRFFLDCGHGYFQPTRGTVQENIDYCAKDGDFHEFGKRPQDRNQQGHHGARGGARGGEMEKARWEAAWAAAKEGRIEDIPADIRSRYLSTWLRVKSMNLPKPEDLDNLDNLWIHGETGSGKSLWVHRTFPGAYKKGFSKWWCGFNSDDPEHQVVVLDDVHPSWPEKVHLKNWADHYPFVAEYKGGSTVIRPKKIIITSNYHPQQMFKQEDLGPILRRFKVVNVADLPPAPPKRRRLPEGGDNTEGIILEDIDEAEFNPDVQEAVLPEQLRGSSEQEQQQGLGQENMGQQSVNQPEISTQEIVSRLFLPS